MQSAAGAFNTLLTVVVRSPLIMQVAIIVPPVSQSTHECQTSDDLDDVLAPTSPKLVGEAASPRGEAPRLQGEASMPQLQDLVAGAPDSDAARCISDQYNAGIAAAAAAASSASAVKGSSPIKLPLGEDAAVQDLMQVLAHARGLPLAAALDRANHHLAEQGLSGRLEVQHSKPAAAASSSSGGLFGTPLAAAAGRPAGILDLDGQQQLGSPLAEAAGQQPVGIPRSLLSGDSSSDRRSSGFVTHDQLSLALMEREFERVKEKNSALKSRNSLLESENKVMQQQLQQLSPAVTPLVPSSAYINRTRGSAGTPSPFNHGFGGQPGSGMRFSPPVNAQLSAPRSGSMLDASSAAASSSCFRGMPVPSPQAPGSVGSTRHSPQGQAVATPGTAPGSATSSASRRTVEPVPMQPLDAAGSPAGRPSPVMQQQPQGQPAAKQLVEALEKARIKQAQVSFCCCHQQPAVLFGRLCVVLCALMQGRPVSCSSPLATRVLTLCRCPAAGVCGGREQAEDSRGQDDTICRALIGKIAGRVVTGCST
jgi:hypothetical protein